MGFGILSFGDLFCFCFFFLEVPCIFLKTGNTSSRSAVLPLLKQKQMQKYVVSPQLCLLYLCPGCLETIQLPGSDVKEKTKCSFCSLLLKSLAITINF